MNDGVQGCRNGRKGISYTAKGYTMQMAVTYVQPTMHNKYYLGLVHRLNDGIDEFDPP